MPQSDLKPARPFKAYTLPNGDVVNLLTIEAVRFRPSIKLPDGFQISPSVAVFMNLGDQSHPYEATAYYSNDQEAIASRDEIALAATMARASQVDKPEPPIPSEVWLVWYADDGRGWARTFSVCGQANAAFFSEAEASKCAETLSAIYGKCWPVRVK